MRKVDRSEIVDYVTYNETRDAFRAQVLEAKAPRRLHVAPAFTFLFENALTVRYQVQEMMRAEQIVRESDVRHELDTYNELLGGPGELGATMLIEIDDADERARLLTAWRGVMPGLYARLASGEKVRAQYDARQVGDTRLSSVQYLKFDVRGGVPVAFGFDAEALTTESPVPEAVQAALREDLRSDL